MITEYFANYFLHMSDVTFNMMGNSIKIHQSQTESWTVTLTDTGEDTMTGGRFSRVKKYLMDESEFCFTYGYGDITALIQLHKSHGKQATLTATRPLGRYGALMFGENDSVKSFEEKPKGDESWINGEFFVLHPDVIDRINGGFCSWEGSPLMSLAPDDQLSSFRHDGFWQPMDTLREKNHLNELWAAGKAPWKVW